MANEPYFDTYLDDRVEWRWRFRAANGKIIADSAEGYKEYGDCLHAIKLLKRDAPGAPVR